MTYKRAPAVKVTCAEMHAGEVVETENGLAVTTTRGPVTRVNILGVVVADSPVGIVIDDKTAQVRVNGLSGVVGQPVLVVGRPRAFQQQVYIEGELVKHVDPEWLRVRSKELQRTNEDLLSQIRRLDDGEGVDVDALSNSGELKQLLQNGDVFEVKPGRVKILE